MLFENDLSCDASNDRRLLAIIGITSLADERGFFPQRFSLILVCGKNGYEVIVSQINFTLKKNIPRTNELINKVGKARRRLSQRRCRTRP